MNADILIRIVRAIAHGSQGGQYRSPRKEFYTSDAVGNLLTVKDI